MKSIKDIINQHNLTSEYANNLVNNEHIFNEIYKECGYSFIPGDGSYLFEGSVYEYSEKMYPKQLLLYEIAKKSSSVLEIGVYMGHSLFIMLLANPYLNITAIDIVDKYSLPAIKILKKYFPDSKIDFYHGDSLHILPNIKNNKFDFFHIDGHHLEEHIKNEVFLCEKLSSNTKDNEILMKILFDDVHCCQGFINNIISKNKVLNFIKPDCIWANSYIEYIAENGDLKK